MQPILFQIGPLAIHSYGFFVFLAVIFGILIFFLQAKKRRLETENLLKKSILVIVFGFLGARVGYVLANLEEFKNFWEIFFFWQGGFVFYGGLLLGGISFWKIFLQQEVKSKNKQERKLAWLDCFALGGILAHSIGRIGCFLNGCCQGKIVSSEEPYRYPTQLYESFAYFLIFAILYWLGRSKNLPAGFIFFPGLFFHSLARFIIEFYRENDFYLFDIFSLTQIITLGLILVGMIGIAKIWRFKKI